ncbi:hypothetical protein GQ43DRAFT_495327 [Delitschia confertaspora ATCC 74209]|uniref:Uncharacterized protein n=1 Tax=Delitschia confertaspora ATCC 74209 TaxID=1513339 RepID=A0A9P4MV44_9PLEO|nr:hypothetical protein GQ43DRAFT_495327 [Delitschia confertaspora ATCC 74209]
MVGHLYKLDLLPEMNIHPVLHVDRLRKAAEPVPGQEEPDEQPIIVNGENK